MKEIGKRLLQARKEKNLSMKELSIITGISDGTISNYENNKTEPKAIILEKICKGLDKSIEWVISDKETINDLTEDEKTILEEYRKLTRDEKSEFRGAMKDRNKCRTKEENTQKMEIS